jgi:hypothetical protein
MALIVVFPLLFGVLFAGRRWHTAQAACLAQRTDWQAFYTCGCMIQEIEALREMYGQNGTAEAAVEIF